MRKLSVRIVVYSVLLISAICVHFGALPVGAVNLQEPADGFSSPEDEMPAAMALGPADGNDTGSAKTTTVSPAYEAPYDQSFIAQRWALTPLDVPAAWAAGYAGRSVMVAVLDTGIDREISYLADRVVREANFSDSANTADMYGHGTHMAGTVLAVAPEARLMNVKVADDRGNCEPSAVAAGIRWAATNGADVINLSLTTQKSTELEKAVEFAHAEGALVVAAAGNGGSTKPSYPGYYEECVAVAALDMDGSLTVLSNHGEWVDMAGPGFDIYSTLPDGGFGYKTGTSPAAAHVSGVAALSFAAAEDTNGNGLLNDEVRVALEASCSSTGVSHVGCGLVNALQAVTR